MKLGLTSPIYTPGSAVGTSGGGGGGGGGSRGSTPMTFPEVTGYSGTGGGSFNINSGRCPPGYNTINRGTFKQCVPKPQPVYRPQPQPQPQPQRPAVITVSPTFQQQFTPQFSPTMQQQQDSPGASQAAQPTQEISTPQNATTGVTPSGPSYVEIAMRKENERLRAEALLRIETENARLRDERARDAQLQYDALLRANTPVITPQEITIPAPQEIIPVPTQNASAPFPSRQIPAIISPSTNYARDTGPTYSETKKEVNFLPWLVGGGLLLLMTG